MNQKGSVTMPKYKILEMGIYPREQVALMVGWVGRLQKIHEFIFEMPIGGAAAHFLFDTAADALKIVSGLKQNYYGKWGKRFPFKISLYRGAEHVFITKDFK